MTTEVITSTRNQRVVAAAKLARKQERDARRRYLIEGPNAVAVALERDAAVRIFVTEDLLPDYDHAPCEVVVVAEHVMDRLADSVTPQGVVAVADIQQPTVSAVVGRGVLVVLDGVSDPGNAGTIIRTADAAGVVAVVLTPGSVDPWNPKAVRASAGSILRMPVVTDVALGELAAGCRAAGQRVLAVDAGGTEDVFDIEGGPVALVFGNEAHGLPDDVSGLVDGIVRIPMPGAAESLNLAAAAAVAVYAAVRRPRSVSSTGPDQEPRREST